MNTEQVYDVWTDRIEVSRRLWRGLAICFMLAVVGAVIFLLASGPYTAPSRACCSAKSCQEQEMHK